jgi:hypothetical protein
MTTDIFGTAGACLRRDAVRALGEHRVRTAIGLREYLRPWPGVLVDPRRATEPLTVVTAAWLTSGPDTVVAGPTAAFLHGCAAADPVPVHLMVPYEHHKRRRSGIILHNGSALAADTVGLSGLPVLGMERALVDVLCTVRPSTALAIVDQALGQMEAPLREAFRARIGERLRHRPDTRGTRVGARLLDLATGLAESPAESWLLWRLVDLGFPVPEVNYWVCTIDGVPIFRLDISWPSLRIAVEYNGYAAHAGRPEEDEHRIRDLERRGWIVIVVDVDDLHSSGRMVRELEEAFLARGMDVRTRTPGALRPRAHRERRAG